MTQKLTLSTLKLEQLVYDNGTATASKPAPSSTEKAR